jgi:dolichyl-phosphate-mannose--protein O-mannosyl transferase
LGCVISVKYTGLGCVGFIGVHQFISVVYAHRKVWDSSLKVEDREIILHELYLKMAIKAFIILSIMITVFVSIWIIHISVLPYQGQGDGFMDERYQTTLVPYQPAELIAEAKAGGCPNHANSWLDCGYPTISEEECIQRGCCWDPTSKSKWCYFSHYTKPTPKHLSMLTKIRMVLHATWANNQGEELNEHPTMSRWWEWPFLTGKLVDYGFGIYSVGNVVVWYLSAISVILCTIILPVLIITNNIDAVPSLNIISLLIGYYGCLLPFYLIVRSTWNYHYTLALLFGIILSGYAFELLLKSKKMRTVAFITMLVLMVSIVYTFYHYSSFTYGSTKSHSQNLELRLFEKWLS